MRVVTRLLVVLAVEEESSPALRRLERLETSSLPVLELSVAPARGSQKKAHKRLRM